MKVYSEKLYFLHINLDLLGGWHITIQVTQEAEEGGFEVGGQFSQLRSSET